MRSDLQLHWNRAKSLRKRQDDDALEMRQCTENAQSSETHIVLSSPLNVIQDDVSIDRQMRHRVQRDTVLKVLDLLLQKIKFSLSSAPFLLLFPSIMFILNLYALFSFFRRLPLERLGLKRGRRREKKTNCRHEISCFSSFVLKSQRPKNMRGFGGNYDTFSFFLLFFAACGLF